MTVNDMHDILPIEDFLFSSPFGFWTRFVFVLTVLLAIILAGLVVYTLWRRFSGGVKPVRPDEQALQGLAGLVIPAEAQELPDFYFRLSTLLRHYIEHHLNLNFIDKTEEEILAHPECFDAIGLDKDEWERMKNFWQRGQVIKFAASSVSQDKVKSDVDFVRWFVDTTRALPGSRKK